MAKPCKDVLNHKTIFKNLYKEENVMNSYDFHYPYNALILSVKPHFVSSSKEISNF